MTDNAPELPASIEPAPSPAPRRRRTVVLALALATIVALGGVLGGASESGAARYDASVESTIADIQSYWSQTLPSVYHTSYKAIPADRLYAYSASNPPPSCGGSGRTPYSEVAGNAFYCDQGDFVAWDDQGLFAKLRARYGDFAPALVLAHEWGHAIQARVGFETSETVYMEQQADCFAGAWAAHIAQDGRMAESDLDSALVGLLNLRDPSGIDGSEDGAHGNGFDRVRAFQDGFEGGASTCADYAKNPPTITESAFTSYADYASGGDMSLNELLPALTRSLQSYWSSAVSGAKAAPKVVAADGTQASACGGNTDGGVLSAAVVYCPEIDTIVYDRVALQKAHDSVGDFGAGVLLASEWSSAVQQRLGESLGSTGARATATCLTGAYTASLDGSARRASANDITLSPGDLDEVIAMLVKTDTGDSSRGSAFSRVAAFRTGYFQGVSACGKA